MKSHVLAWLGLCCAFYCIPSEAFAKTDRFSTMPALGNEVHNRSPIGVLAAAPFQQDTTVKPKDTTKPSTAPVVITPSTGDSANKAKQDTTPTRKDTTVQPAKDSAAKDTSGKAAKDTGLIVPQDSATQAAQKTQQGGQPVGNRPAVTGTVKDATGTAIPGAMIQNKNTTETVQSSPDGTFTIRAAANDQVLISAPTYNEQTIPIKDGSPLEVALTAAESSSKTLSTVVVTALGIKKNTRAVGYALQEVSGNAVQEAKEVNFVNSLSGKVAGMQVSTNTGSMGGSSKVTIRGNKSILGDNNAFFIIDGVPILNNSTNSAEQQRGGGGYDFGSPLQDLNPEDIENISVLKGAAATAIYGSRGANGVVQITTKKRPDTEKGLGITYSLNAQMDQVYVLPKYQNQYGGGTKSEFEKLYYNQHPDAFLNEQSAAYDDNDGKGRYDLLPEYIQDQSWGPKLDGRQVRHYWSWDKDKGNPDFGKTAPWSPNPNNVKDFYKTGFTITNNIAVAGSSDKGSFRLSYGNMNQTFVIDNATLKRNNLSFNGNYNLTKNLHAVASVNYSMLKAKARPGTGFTGPNPTLQFTMFGQRQLDDARARNYKFEDGTQLGWNRKSWDIPTIAYSNGPYWNRYMDYETDSRNRMFGFAGLDYEVNKWLNLSGRVFMDDYNTLEEERAAQQPGILSLGDPGVVGSYIKRVRTSREMNYQFTANVNTEIAKDFTLNATVGGNVMHRQWTTTGGSTNSGLAVPGIYNLANSVQPPTPLDEFFEKQINSAFATASFGYNNLLFLELTGRSDWSSTINKKNNPYIYPSASVSFVFSDLLKQWKWMDFGKVRASIASVGSDTDPYRIYDAYMFQPPFNGNPNTSFQTTKFNLDLKAERTREYEAGLSMQFLDSRIGFDVTYYNRTTKDQILQLLLPVSTGYYAAFVNGGTVRNQGFEVAVNFNPIRLKNGFRWDITGNWARNRNKLMDMNITEYNTSLDQILLATDRRTGRVAIVAKVGEPLGTITGYDYEYDEQGNKLVNADGTYKVSSAVKPIGNVNPDFVGGVTNSFSYKGIYLSALVDFQSGGDFFSYTNLYGKKSGLLDVTAENGIRENGIIVPGVTEDGKPNTTSITAQNHFSLNGGNTISKADLYDASYVYLREVKLGYNFPETWFKNIGVQAARVSLYGRNLWLIHSNAPNVDPSNITNSSSNVQGIEGGALPSLRSYGVNLNVSF